MLNSIFIMIIVLLIVTNCLTIIVISDMADVIENYRHLDKIHRKNIRSLEREVEDYELKIK